MTGVAPHFANLVVWQGGPHLTHFVGWQKRGRLPTLQMKNMVMGGGAPHFIHLVRWGMERPLASHHSKGERKWPSSCIFSKVEAVKASYLIHVVKWRGVIHLTTLVMWEGGHATLFI